MYKLVLYGLCILAAISFAFTFFGGVSFTFLQLLSSLVAIFLTCYIVDTFFAFVFKVGRNSESWLITALILFFILAPVAHISDLWPIIIAASLAVASKYLISPFKKHIFNPAAFGVAILSLAGNGAAIWWVATPWLLPFVIILGLCIVRKLRRFELFFTFFVLYLALDVIVTLYTHGEIVSELVSRLLSWPTIFFGTIMLTEPLTTPPTRALRITYGAIVAVFFGLPIHYAGIYMSPQLALIFGNIFSYIVSPKFRAVMKLRSKKQLSQGVYEYSFEPDKKFAFVPGQYAEWTLAHQHVDIRGNRRYFTISSAPEDNTVSVGIRMFENGSSFKKALSGLSEGAVVSLSSLSGDFTLPKNLNAKFAFVAGGVGITPFVSMLRHIQHTGEHRDVAMIYAASAESDFAYKDLIESTKENGIKPIYTVARFTEDNIKSSIPDYKERVFYISGPHVMVESYKNMLKNIGVSNIVTDYFPGY